MKISVLTICPELFDSYLKDRLVLRAQEKGLLEIEIVDIKNFAGGSFRHIDDSTFGGGVGMIMRAAPILKALEYVKSGKMKQQPAGSGTGDDASRAAAAANGAVTAGGDADSDAGGTFTAVLSPSGYPYTQKMARELTQKEHLILVCGRFEGIDARVMKHADTEISVGDYILSGGEIPAMLVADSIIRLLPGVLRQASTQTESFESGILEYPQYTQPADLDGDCVPEVLLSGNHEAIRQWRESEALRLTRERRPDLLNN